ncbi:uncharacterized protein ACMZJ9_016772 [Mantella aurantiaca]
MLRHPECDCPSCDIQDPITLSCDWLAGPRGLIQSAHSVPDRCSSTISWTDELRAAPSLFRMGPHPCNGSDRAWLSRWLEVTAERLTELRAMRQEAEDRVRRVLDDDHMIWTKWQRNVAAEDSMGRVKAKPRRNHDSEKCRAKNLELEHIEEEVLGVTTGKRPKRSSTSHIPDLDPCMEQGKGRAQGSHDPQHSQVPALTQELLQKMILGDNAERDHVKPTRSKEIHDRFFQPSEPYFLHKIGSGSLPPRLRLGSSGVTSDLLFTRRFSGNCLSTHSSGFYENSDLDSISSSCSSLCSDSSCHTSISMMSPHRSSGMRPRSIDYTNERRKELQNGRAQPRRPISAGALEGFSLSPISTSRYDITQYNDRTTCDYTYSPTPPLCAIQQRRKAERYICKLALKYRCKPGVTNPLPDLGPPTPRTPVSFPYSESYNSCPPSPQSNSLSSSLGDVRKIPKGSWGRFFSRVMLKKDSRIAASELNLQHCIINPQNRLRSPSLAEGQLVRAKSFRDLLSVNPFKRSQRGLNKVW